MSELPRGTWSAAGEGWRAREGGEGGRGRDEGVADAQVGGTLCSTLCLSGSRNVEWAAPTHTPRVPFGELH